MSEEKSHNDIYQAIGALQGTVDGIKQDVHQVRLAQIESEKRQLQDLHELRKDQIEYGRRIASLEKVTQWVKGLAIGVILIAGMLASDLGEFLKGWFGLGK